MVNPTLVTPGPQPLQAGPPVDEAQVLRSEVIGPRHARRRPVDNRRKAAAGAILLSATGAATALFMLMGKDAREATAASGHDTSTAVPDEPESHTVPYVEAAVGDTPLRGARAEKPKPQQPAAQPVAQAPAADPTPDKPRTPSAGKGRSTPSWPGWSSRGPGQYDDWQDAVEAFDRWAEQQQERQRDEGGGYGGGYGGGQGGGYDGGYGGGTGYGGDYGGGYGGGHRR
ncbi:hypothetical protein GCM10017744_076560 [Streptomyces antimycoticus]|uniref:hypothetical protein n=1 Tax=Streptomyces antimycoticus TaxID=68175 RepID=UPI0031EDBA79